MGASDDEEQADIINSEEIIEDYGDTEGTELSEVSGLNGQDREDEPENFIRIREL